MDLGKLVRKARKRKKLSQVQLAAQTGVSLPTIQNIEANKGNPTISVLEKVCSPLDISLEFSDREPKWALLQTCGLPIEVEKNNQKNHQCPTPQQLTRELTSAVRYLTKEFPSKDKRVEESVASMLCTIKHHYSTFYLYNLENPETIAFLKRNPMTGRTIKLMRMVNPQLSLIL